MEASGTAADFKNRKVLQVVDRNAKKKEEHTEKKFVSFEEECHDKGEGTVILIGDSMVRGVGNHLHADNIMFGKLDFGGA
jgi:hypothetical protein